MPTSRGMLGLTDCSPLPLLHVEKARRPLWDCVCRCGMVGPRDHPVSEASLSSSLQTSPVEPPHPSHLWALVTCDLISHPTRYTSCSTLVSPPTAVAGCFLASPVSWHPFLSMAHPPRLREPPSYHPKVSFLGITRTSHLQNLFPIHR